jgi:N-acetylneuraminic acid mutarotase
MKKLLLSLLVPIAIGISSLAFSQGTWTPRDTLPYDTAAMEQGLLGFSIGNYGYAGLGSNSVSNLTAFWRFDPSTNSWSQKAFFPGKARISPADFVIGDKAYIVCGSVKNFGACVNECWEYDATTDSWTQKANFPGTARVYAVGFAIDSLGYVGTGANELMDFRKDFYAYHPSTNTWIRIADLPAIARDADGGFVVNGKGYICGGQDSLYKAVNDLWEYDPVTNIWTQKANYPHPLMGTNGFAICNNIYVYGDSTDGFDFYREFWKYNTISDTWTQEGNMPGKLRYLSMAFSIADSGYSGFGVDTLGQFPNALYKYYGGDSCQITTNNTKTYNSNQMISVYPNPFTNKCIISFSSTENPTAEFLLFDLAGKAKQIKLEKSENQYILYSKGLQDGMYILQIKINDISFFKKLIITN